jgi:hypothetical protein
MTAGYRSWYSGTREHGSARAGGPCRTFNEVRRQLQTHTHVTLQLVWEEYLETQPDGYSYSHYVASVFMLRNHVNPVTDARSGDVDAT